MSSVKGLSKKYRKHGTMKQQKGSGCQRSARTPENEAVVDLLTGRNIAQDLEISHYSVYIMV